MTKKFIPIHHCCQFDLWSLTWSCQIGYDKLNIALNFASEFINSELPLRASIFLPSAACRPSLALSFCFSWRCCLFVLSLFLPRLLLGSTSSRLELFSAQILHGLASSWMYLLWYCYTFIWILLLSPCSVGFLVWIFSGSLKSCGGYPFILRLILV